jgi:MFS family permease
VDVGERPSPLLLRASVLGGLYLVQGLVFGVGGYVLLPQLAAAGVHLEYQGAIWALVSVPWVLKLAWAVPLDSKAARRIGAGRIAAVAMVTIAAAFLVVARLADPSSSLVALALAWLVANAALSLQDVATDALSFDLLAPQERGRAVAVMLAAHHVGADLLAGKWIGSVAASRGLGASCVLVAIVVLVLATLGLVVPRGSSPVRNPIGAAIRGLLRDRTSAWALAICALVFAADAATSGVGSELLVNHLGWTQDEVSARVTTPNFTGYLAGYAIAVAFVDRFGHRAVARVSTVALAACWIGFALVEPMWANTDFMMGFIFVQGLVTAWLYTAMHTLILDVVHQDLRATQIAVLTSMLNLPRVWAPLVAAWAVPAMGFAGLFAACGVWQIAMALPLATMRSR